MSQTIQIGTPQDEMVPGHEALKTLWLADLKKLMLLRRANLAQQWQVPLSLLNDGASPVQVTQSGGSILKGALIGAACLLAGGLGGAGLMALLPKTPVPVVAPAATPASAPAVGAGQVTIGINEDGTLYDPSKK